MSNRVLVLGIGPLRDRFFVTAARLGVETILIDETAYSRYDRLCDETHAWRLWDHGRPGPEFGRLEELRGRVDGVLALNDWSSPIAAELAQRWGLPGVGAATVARGHDKYAVRERLAAAGVDDTAHQLVRDAEGVREFFARTGADAVVLKPLDGGASLGVRIAGSPEQAVAALPEAYGFSGRDAVLAEEYLDGTEYSLEAVVRAGRTVATVVTEKICSAPPRFIELRHLVSPPGAPHEAGAAEFVQGLVDALEIDDAVLHVEAKLTGRGWRLIEVALRPAGGLIADLVAATHGINLYEEQLRLALGMPGVVPTTPGGVYAGVQFAAGVGTVVDAPSMFEVRDGLDDIRFAERLLPPGTPVPDVSANWWRAGYVLGVGADRARLEEQLATGTRRLLDLVGLAPMASPVAVPA